jgi:pimeloyl-ACP methyl ester carboxylesterase
MSNQYIGAGYACQYKRRSTRVDALKLEYFVGGKGEPLIYLHGLGGWLAWDTDHIGLALTNTVYAPMLPGWKAGQIPAGITSVRNYARVITGFMDTVGVNRADIVGHSLGGWIALYLAAEDPERVARLVVVDSLGLEVPQSPAADLSTLDETALFNATFAAKGGTLVIAGDFGGLPEKLRSSPAFLAERVGQRNLVALTGGKCYDPDLAKRLSNIKASTLIVWGREDGIVPLLHAQRLAALIPGSKAVVIDDAGHIPMKEKRQTFLQVVRGFLLDQESMVEGAQSVNGN